MSGLGAVTLRHFANGHKGSLGNKWNIFKLVCGDGYTTL